MNIKPIKTEKDYRKALEEIDRIFDAKPNTPDGDTLEVLTTLVEKYEDEHYPIEAPDPVEALQYFMESRGLSRVDLEEYIGGSGRISEVLRRKRGLSLSMIRKLHFEDARQVIKSGKVTNLPAGGRGAGFQRISDQAGESDENRRLMGSVFDFRHCEEAIGRRGKRIGDCHARFARSQMVNPSFAVVSQVLFKGERKNVLAGTIAGGLKEKEIRCLREGNRAQRLEAGAGNGTGRQPDVAIGVIGRIDIQVGRTQRSFPPGLASLIVAKRILHGGVGFQAHACSQPIQEDRGD